MSQCVSSGAPETVSHRRKGHPVGAWEYWVCAEHKAQVDAGAEIHDNPDGRTITID